MALVMYHSEDGEEYNSVPVVFCGELHSYTIPSFPVLTVKLRRIQYECILADQNKKVILDGFIRDDPSLQRLYPAEVLVKISQENACYIEVLDVSESIDVAGFKFIEDRVFIIWKWEWKDDGGFYFNDDDGSATSITVIPETPPESESDEESDEQGLDLMLPSQASFLTHTVTFKCIGCTKELCYQEALCRASQLLRSKCEVKCRLRHEPDNPVDSQAMAFECEVDGSWKVIGYAVQEVLNELHAALKEKKIVSVTLNWIKFIIYWKSPGWYAGIDIKKIGEWSTLVMASQSAKIKQ